MKTFNEQFQNKLNFLAEKLNHLTVTENSQWNVTAFKTSSKSFIKTVILNKFIMRKHNVSESLLNWFVKVCVMSSAEIFRTTACKSYHTFIKNDFNSGESFFINLSFSWNYWIISFLLIYVHSCRFFFNIVHWLNHTEECQVNH